MRTWVSCRCGISIVPYGMCGEGRRLGLGDLGGVLVLAGGQRQPPVRQVEDLGGVRAPGGGRPLVRSRGGGVGLSRGIRLRPTRTVRAAFRTGGWGVPSLRWKGLPSSPPTSASPGTGPRSYSTSAPPTGSAAPRPSPSSARTASPRTTPPPNWPGATSPSRPRTCSASPPPCTRWSPEHRRAEAPLMTTEPPPERGRTVRRPNGCGTGRPSRASSNWTPPWDRCTPCSPPCCAATPGNAPTPPRSADSWRTSPGPSRSRLGTRPPPAPPPRAGADR